MYPIREKPHRLPKEFYLGHRIVDFTACEKHRKPGFANPFVFNAMQEILIEACEKYKSESFVHLFMPNHAHIVIASGAGGDALSAMKRFKQRSGFWLSKNRPSIHWQKDFYDHILRRYEDLSKHIRYILDNPVRAGLVADWKDWPYRGSMVYDLDSWDVL